MSDVHKPLEHSVKKQPKYCRCRICHQHFYGETIAQAHEACIAHARTDHPDWDETACYCPD